MKQETGQIVLILLLVMSVALAIGLSVVQRSFVDVSTSTKIEQSTRAFSAAEAGIEKIVQQSPNPSNFPIPESTFKNNASALVEDSGLLPIANQALEYPPVSKEGIVHVWLSDPNDDLTDIQPYYKKDGMILYWGVTGIGINDNSANAPALEVIIVSISNDNKTYTSKKILLDSNPSRENNFIKPTGVDPAPNIHVFTCSTPTPIVTIFGNNRQFRCYTELKDLISQGSKLVLLRGRFLYTSTTHPFAVMPSVGNECTVQPVPQKTDCSLPPQVRLVKSIGSSGSTKRTIQLFQVMKVVPFYFDYAIFTAGDIEK